MYNDILLFKLKKEGNSGIYYNRVNLEDILLSKMSVTKDMYCVMPLT